MNEERVTRGLEGLCGHELAKSLVTDFIKIRQDYATRTLERACAGKFVETFVQCLQQIAHGTYEGRPDVDRYLASRVESEALLADGLRVCAARIARSIYTLRNKRNIAHKNPVDSNTADLAFIHQGAVWILAELLRNASSITMEEAAALVEFLYVPVGTLVEEIDGVRLVHADVSIRVELLILLHSSYPATVPMSAIYASLEGRNPGSVRSQLAAMRGEKLVHGDAKQGYRLTQAGYAGAVSEIRGLQAA